MKINWIVLPMILTLSSFPIKALSTGDITCNEDKKSYARIDDACMLGRLICNNHVTCRSVTCSNGNFYPCGTE
jgi:hypothetical protein